MKKIRPSEQKRKELEGLLEQDALAMIEEFHRVGQEKLYQEALEAQKPKRRRHLDWRSRDFWKSQHLSSSCI